MKFIKVTTKKPALELNEEFLNIPPVISARIFTLESEIKDFALENRLVSSVYMTPTAYQWFEWQQLYKTTDVEFIIEDLTAEALYGFYNNQDADVVEALSNWKFQELLKHFIDMNSDTDTVLEKISKHGIGSLTEADRHFL